MHIFAFPSSIFYVIVQNLHKNGWIEIQFLFDHLLLIIIEVLKTFSQTLKDSVTTSLCKFISGVNFLCQKHNSFDHLSPSLPI